MSMWGHDFRPDYLFIRRALDELDAPAVLGMTATATPATADAIGAGARAAARARPHERAPAEPPLRRRARRERRGAAPRAAPPAARPLGRRGDRVRPLAALVRGDRTHAPRARDPRRALPRRARARRADARAGVLRRGPHPGRRRDHGVRDGDRQGERPPRRARQLPGLARELRPDGRQGRTRRPAERHRAARRGRRRLGAASLRAGRRADARISSAASTAPCGTRVARSTPEALEDAVGGDHDPRVLVGMLEQAGIVRRGYDAGRAMRIELLPADPGAGGAVDALLDRYERGAADRVERIVSFAETRRCRHLQVAEHFGETLDGAVRRLRRLRPACAAVDRDRTGRRPAPRRPGEDDRGRRRGPHVAARPAQPRGDASRLREGASLRPAVARVRGARRGVGRGGDAVDPRAGGGRRARRGRERRLPRPPRAVRRRPAVLLAVAGGAGARPARRRAPRLAVAARARGRRARLRRAARRDARRARVAEAGVAGRARRRARASARRSSSATATSCSSSSRPA